jgi:hypothetical protein
VERAAASGALNQILPPRVPQAEPKSRASIAPAELRRCPRSRKRSRTAGCFSGAIRVRVLDDEVKRDLVVPQSPSTRRITSPRAVNFTAFPTSSREPGEPGPLPTSASGTSVAI